MLGTVQLLHSGCWLYGLRDATNFDSAATSDDGSCTYEVIFTVDMNQYGVAGVDYTTPEVNGSFNGWCGGCRSYGRPI